MTNKERVIAALQRKTTDCVPWHIDFTGQEYHKMVDYYKDENFYARINSHLSAAGSDDFFTEVKPGYFKDIYGVIWNRTGADKDIGVIDNYVISEPSLKGFKLPEVNSELLHKNYAWLAGNKTQFTMGSVGFSLFERAWTLCGMENVLMYMICEKQFLHDLLDMICERNLKVVDIAMQYDLDSFYFGDDWGQQKGLIMGPDHWREFIKPRLKKMYGAVKKQGRYVAQHSCGDIGAVFPDVIECGLDIYNTFQPEIYDIRKFKETYGDKLAVWGGISTQHVLAHGTPEDVKRETIETIKVMGKNGGYIAAPTHGIPGDVPAENVDMLIRVLKNQNDFLN